MEQRARRATWNFTAASVAVAAALAVAVSTVGGPPDRPITITWPLLAIAFGVAERYSVEIEVRREAQSLNFSEIPLTIGMMFADPISVVVARLVGATSVFAAKRPAPVKIVFNAAAFTVETSVALLVYHAVLGGTLPIEPRGWAAAFLGVLASAVVVWAMVTAVIRLAGAPVTLASATRVLGTTAAAGLAASAIAVAAGSALWRDGRSWVLFLFIGTVLGYFFLSFVRIRERHRSMADLHEFTTKLERIPDRDVLVAACLTGVEELLHAERAIMLLPDAAATMVRLEMRDEQLKSSTLQRSEFDVVLAASAGDRSGHGAASIAGVDLSRADTMAVRLSLEAESGLLVLDGRIAQNRPFDAEDFQVLETAAGHISSALRNAQLVERLREEARYRSHQALHDDVTDLPNQRALLEKLTSQLAVGTRLALLTVRINSLREVNETLGRAVGDEMLRQVSARMRPVGRDAWCARSGTDEFSLVITGGPEDADTLAHAIVDAFELPVLCHEVALAVTVGIGVVVAPAHGTEAETLLRRASLAASRTVLDGTSVSVWAADRDPYDPQRLTIAADLRDAIPAGELQVHFQPQLDLRTGAITGAEALVRWRHPRLGELRPDQFIAAAENTGAIDALTLHVLTVAAEAGARWRQRGWDLDVGVNLSARNLTNSRFTGAVEAVLAETGLPASALILELTESSVMTEAERAMTTLRELDDLGIELSIDDFGTGYSSLAHLRRLPVSEIKIDKSFVFDLTTSESDEAIVRSLIELGHNLGLTVVVEGVETVEVRNKLQELGSDRLQGYLLSRPLTIEAFENWVSERPVRTLAGDPRHRVVRLDQRR